MTRRPSHPTTHHARSAPPDLRIRSAFTWLAFAALLFAGTAAPARGAETRAIVTTTDFSTGGVSAVDLATRAVSRDVASVYRDTRARWYDGQLYVLNRLGQDNLQVIDPATWGTVHQFSLGNGANPSDLVLTSPSRAYVALYQRPYLLVMNPQTGATLGTIDLAPFADADGIPEADHMARFGRWIFVSLERLDENQVFAPTDTSLVVVIDTAADTVVDVNPALPGRQAIVLPRVNPATSFAWDPVGRRFYLGCVGRYGVLDGGIVRVDPAAFRADGVAATEAQLGGDVADLEWHTATHGYAIVTDASFNASLVAWNPQTGLPIRTVFGPVTGLTDCALDDRGELYLCDNSYATPPGIRVFQASTDAPLAGPLDTGRPPWQVMFDGLSPDVLDVPVAPTPAAMTLALTAPAPNPAAAATSLTLTLSRSAQVAANVFDVSGRRVRSLLRGGLGAGAHVLEWDLRDERGGRVAPGVYVIRAQSGGAEVARRVVIAH